MPLVQYSGEASTQLSLRVMRVSAKQAPSRLRKPQHSQAKASFVTLIRSQGCHLRRPHQDTPPDNSLRITQQPRKATATPGLRETGNTAEKSQGQLCHVNFVPRMSSPETRPRYAYG
ncbi:hypothetical protein E2C01_068613 [Portunus trituberculatus]|uniref:Uncharacterized protein n=1 Tax=Portunus trituberculatus TaxID=210409 RepID=A0A5B7HWX3_PORTR|nr:hypothetical protein [Portunus trituberculatus]